MNRLLFATAVVALFSIAGCGSKDQAPAPATPAVEPPAQQGMASTPAAVPTGPSSDQSSLAASTPSSSSSSGTSDTVATNDSNTTGNSASSGSPSSSSASTAAGGGPSSTDSTVTDSQILQALHTANSGEVEQAKLAQKKSKNAQVKHFAAMMIKDHTDADHKGKGVAKKVGVSPSPTSMSTTLESDAKQHTSTMSSRTGGDFDKAYIGAQVTEHQAVLDLIDTQLLPHAEAADVKSFVQAVRGKVESHLKEAQDIQRKLGGS